MLTLTAAPGASTGVSAAAHVFCLLCFTLLLNTEGLGDPMLIGQRCLRRIRSHVLALAAGILEGRLPLRLNQLVGVKQDVIGAGRPCQLVLSETLNPKT